MSTDMTKALKIVAEFIGGCVMGVVGVLVAWVSNMVLYEYFGSSLDWAGLGIATMYFGFPIGSVFGIWFLDRVVFKSKGYATLGVILAVPVCVIAAGLCHSFFLNVPGGIAFFVVLVPGFALASFHAPKLF